MEAKRKLSDIDFSKEGAHMALTSKTINGGPANQRTTLLFKAVNVEEIEKAEVQVKMDVVNFLRKFFNMWTDEAATLAQIFGMEQSYFDDSFPFEEFNSLGASEVTLLKSVSGLEKTENALSDFVDSLSIEEVGILKGLTETFNEKHKELDMSQDLEKSLAEKDVALTKALEKAEAAEAKLLEIEKAVKEAKKEEFIKKAESLGLEKDLGEAMATISDSEEGALVIKALEAAHAKLDEIVEKEEGFSGDAEEAEQKVSGVMKALQAQSKKAK